MPALIATWCVLAATPPPNEAMTASARIEAPELKPGGEYEIVVEVQMGDGYSRTFSGVPDAILQVGVPRSVELVGTMLKTYAELSNNDFVQEPYERMLKESPARVRFKLLKPPAADDRIELHVLVYASRGGDRENRWFIRRRLLLPVAAGASAEPAAPTSSEWGRGNLLQIGDKADAFTLPRSDGKKVSLAEFRGKQYVLVTTFRAHW